MRTSQTFLTLRNQQLTERWLGTGSALCLSHDLQFLQQNKFMPAVKAE
jgi:ABC-type taurine transport system substrate-binding protein